MGLKLPLLIFSWILSCPALAAPFFWGVANSSFQVEGSPEASDWRAWTHESGRIADHTNADQATDFWNRYQEDFALAQKMGLNAFRISIAWERIEPSPGVWDRKALEHYRQMIVSMRSYGLEPIVTLHHFVTPEWLAKRGGLEASDFPQQFTAYARTLVSYLSDPPAQVKFWLTFNEPNVLVLMGYVTGEFPPGVKSPSRAIGAAANLIRAHIEAVHAIRELHNPELKIGIAQNWAHLEPLHPHFFADRWLTNIVADLYNYQAIDAMMTGHLQLGLKGILSQTDDIGLPDGRPSLDFLGINYYSRTLVGLSLLPPFLKIIPGDGPKSDLEWETFPEGIYQSLTLAFERWKIPLLISENGIADAGDTKRADYLFGHLEQIQRARSQGIPLWGYLHWSLTDNFEWALGLTPRFGLIKIDYNNRSLRELRPSASAYKAWVLEHP